MGLCNLCENFDIRQLGCQSATQKPGAIGTRDRNLFDTNYYYAAMPNVYKHQEGRSALKKFADQACELCDLFWYT